MIPLVLFLDLSTVIAELPAAAPLAPSSQAQAPATNGTPAPDATLAVPNGNAGQSSSESRSSNAAPVFFARLGAGLGELAGVGFYRLPIQVGGFALSTPKGGMVYGLGYAYGRTPNGLSIHEITTSIGGRLSSEAFNVGAQLEIGALGFSRVTTGSAIFAPTIGVRVEAAVRVVKFEEGAGALELGLGGGGRLAPGGLSPFGGDLFLRVVL